MKQQSISELFLEWKEYIFGDKYDNHTVPELNCCSFSQGSMYPDEFQDGVLAVIIFLLVGFGQTEDVPG